jgi:hypothetical protein
MKKIFILMFGLLSVVACNEEAKESAPDQKNQAQTAKVEYFGEKITEDGAVPTDSLKAMMGTDTLLNCKLSGTIDAVCQKKGCWMELKNGDGNTVRVTFKDYGFFMPKDASGRTAIVDGIAKVEVTSIGDLKEYAKDDGQSQAEIDAIKEPLRELVFEAKGVIIK